MKNPFKGKTILVTGGTGSIGSEIVRQLLRVHPKVIRIFARHEDRHHSLMQELGADGRKNLRFIVGDVRDRERLKMAMDGIDTVFHAAALKHVPICESNPFEAVKTNIVGTQNIIEIAREVGVTQVLGISTDKVAEPESVLGVSKLMAEKLFLATYFYRGDKKTKFACVRFGNVLGSRGSILPLLKKQISVGGTVTMTEPNMTRFVMSVPQAVNLVLRAASFMRGQEIFVLKMPAVRLEDLIKTATMYYAPLFGKKPSDIKINRIGKREGEKMHEKLLADYESVYALETKDMYILTPHDQRGQPLYEKSYPKAVPAQRSTGYFSKEAPKLSRKELLALIQEADRYQR